MYTIADSLYLATNHRVCASVCLPACLCPSACVCVCVWPCSLLCIIRVNRQIYIVNILYVFNFCRISFFFSFFFFASLTLSFSSHWLCSHGLSCLYRKGHTYICIPISIESIYHCLTTNYFIIFRFSFLLCLFAYLCIGSFIHHWIRKN